MYVRNPSDIKLMLNVNVSNSKQNILKKTDLQAYMVNTCLMTVRPTETALCYFNK